jgi:hypothetical protein
VRNIRVRKDSILGDDAPEDLLGLFSSLTRLICLFFDLGVSIRVVDMW